MLKDYFKFTGDLSNHQKAGRRITIFTSVVIITMLLGVIGVFDELNTGLLSPINGLIMWFSLFCVGFCVVNLFNKEKVPGEKEFSNLAYMALVYSLGMGIGIMTFGFNEAPMLNSYADVRNPLGLVLNHWTIVPFAIYGLFTIFEIYDLKYQVLPNWLRSAKIYIYCLSMMLGIGTSYALGTITIADTSKILYGIDIPSYAIVILLGAAVTISLLRGIHKGMKVFASIAMWMLLIFSLIMIYFMPSNWYNTSLEAVTSFGSDFLYNNLYRGSTLQQDWTVFYDIWWIGWSSFVAAFMVSISKGRTIGNILLYLLVIPAIISAIYMCICGTIGLDLMNKGVETTMIPFEAVKVIPGLPILFIALMAIFYVTSSDSQSFAMDSYISKGSKTPIVYRKILWVFLEVLFVTVLLIAGTSTTKAIQGLSFMFSPIMILFAIAYLYYIGKFYYKKFLTKIDK